MFSPKTLVLLVMVAVPTIGIVIGLLLKMALGPRTSKFLSRLVDEYKIRPSLIEGVISPLLPFIAVLPVLMLRDQSNSTGTFSLGLFVLSAGLISASLGFAIETIRKPPPIEFRPRWYVGEGDPSWVRWRRGMKHPYTQQFTLSWLLISLTIFCALLAFQSSAISAQATKLLDQRRANLLLNQHGIRSNQQDLKLSGLNLTKEEVETILRGSRYPRSLDLSGTEIDDATLALLSNKWSLMTLKVNDTLVTDAGLLQLSEVALGQLEATHTLVTGECLQSLVSVRDVDLRGCPVSRQGLSCILNLSHTAKMSGGAMRVVVDDTELTQKMLGPALPPAWLKLVPPIDAPRQSVESPERL